VVLGVVAVVRAVVVLVVVPVVPGVGMVVLVTVLVAVVAVLVAVLVVGPVMAVLGVVVGGCVVVPVPGGTASRRPHHGDGERLAHVDDLVRTEVVDGEQLVGPGMEPDRQLGGGVAGTDRVVHHPSARVVAARAVMRAVMRVVVPVVLAVMRLVVVPVPGDQLDARRSGDVVRLDLLHGDAGGQHQCSGGRRETTEPPGRPQGRRLGGRWSHCSDPFVVAGGTWTRHHQ
jgi:hypothetical protein